MPYVRGSAYGRAGEFRRAHLRISTRRSISIRAIHQAFANRRSSNATWATPRSAHADYNAALHDQPSYDVAYHRPRQDLYRQAGQLDSAFNDFNKTIQLDTTDPGADHNRGLIYQTRNQHAPGYRRLLDRDLAGSPNSPEPYTAAAFPTSP